MALIVQKFGGTSVANIERINHVAELVVKAKEASHDLVVVVSAMAGETDRLIQLAEQMSHSAADREYAALISTGEQVTMALLAMALEKRGISALSYTGAQAGIITCSQYKKARIQWIDAEKISQHLKIGKVVVVAGFQGVDMQGSITTLGRGGSDTTAVALAAALHADECQIFTDVEGVFTTDPRVVPEARRLEQITFEEMLELASLGSKVLQIRSVEFAGKYNVPLRVLSSMKEGPGTLITYNKSQSMEAPLVSGIAFSRVETKIKLVGKVGAEEMVPQLLAEISALGIGIDMLMQSVTPDRGTELMFMVHQEDHRKTIAHFEAHQEKFKLKEITGVIGLAKLSLVGAGLKSHPSVAATLFTTLATLKIAIQLMTMSEISLSVVIEADKLDPCVQALHRAFGLDKEVEADKSALSQEPVVEENTVVYSEN